MVPEECLYTEDHEWIHIEDNIATIGISEYAAGELGDIVYVELPEVDSDIGQTDPVRYSKNWRLSSVKRWVWRRY